MKINRKYGIISSIFVLAIFSTMVIVNYICIISILGCLIAFINLTRNNEYIAQIVAFSFIISIFFNCFFYMDENLFIDILINIIGISVS